MTSLKELIDRLVDIQDSLDPDVRDEATVLVSLESRYNTVVSDEDEALCITYNPYTQQVVMSSRIPEDAHLFVSFDKEEEDVPA